MIAAGIMTITNVLLDLVAILIFHAGMLGIGLATSIGYLFSSIYCIGYLQKRMKIFQKTAVNIQLWKDLKFVMKYGSSSGLMRVYMAMGMGIVNRLLIATGGAVAVAAYSIWMHTLSILGISLLSVGLSMATVSALLAGEEDKATMMRLLKHAMRFGLKIAIPMTLILFFGAGYVAAIFGISSESPYYAETVLMLRFLAITMVPHIFRSLATNFWGSIGNIFFPNMVLFSYKLGILIPILWFGSYWGMMGIWFGFLLTEFLVLALPVLYIILVDRRLPNMDRILFFGKSIGVPPDMEFVKTIPNDIDAVMDTSIGISEFCNTHHVGKRCALFTSLCLEEMLCNIVTYSYKPGEQHTIDVRIVVKGEELIVCIRNDGQEFNPVKFYEEHKFDDPAANPGIRIIMGIAKDVKYHYLVGMNHLVIVCDNQPAEA